MSTSVDYIQAIAQGQVGDFLNLKSKLITMTSSPVLTISDQATKLLGIQSALEDQLTANVALAKSGSVPDIIQAGGFFIQMEKQISDVNSLYNDYVGLGSSAQASIFSSMPWWAWTGIAGVVVWKVMRKS